MVMAFLCVLMFGVKVAMMLLLRHKYAPVNRGVIVQCDCLVSAKL